MKSALRFFGACLVAAVAFWAYKVNYAAQDALDRVADLRRAIALERDAIRVLEAEWAWLNQPARLRALVDAHGAPLGLAPMSGARYAALSELPLRAVAPPVAPEDPDAPETPE